MMFRSTMNSVLLPAVMFCSDPAAKYLSDS